MATFVLVHGSGHGVWCWEIGTGHDLMIRESQATADMVLKVNPKPATKR